MKIVLIQLCVSDAESIEQRRQRVGEMLDSLQAQDVDFILLPELWGVGFSNFADYAAEEEAYNGITVQQLSAYAKKLDCVILTGSFIEKRGENRYNTMALLNEDGVPLGYYQKIHLFGYASKERTLLTAGKTVSAVQTSLGKIGLATCYDLRFPEQFRLMAEHSAELFAVSAAWPMERLADWRLFCQVRALENQCFLLACNHAGTHGGSTGAGHSMVVAPDGTILAEAGESEQLLTADIDILQTPRTRGQFPAWNDRVPLE